MPTFGFNTQDIKGYNFSYGEIWHTERDLYTKNIPEYQEHAATVTAVVALGIANLSKQLSREGMHKSSGNVLFFFFWWNNVVLMCKNVSLSSIY